MGKIMIGEMSWTEFQDVMKETDTIIIPMGVLEEHGLHNPLGTDTLIAEACAKMIGEKAQVPVAPVMPFGYTPNVTKFAGTISIDAQLMRKVMVSYAESYVKHGAKRFLFVNGHGGNNDLLSLVCADLYEKHGSICAHTQWWETLPQISEFKCNDHGGLFETSLMMAVNDEIVDLSKAQHSPVNGLTEKILYDYGWRYEGARLPIPVDLYGQQKIGNVGEPPFNANKELGKQMMDVYAEYNAGLINELKKITIL